MKAARQVRAAGYTRTDALTPFPVEGLAEALGAKKSPMAALVFLGAVAGGVLALGLQYWASVIQYPHVVAGRPFFSWPAFIPVTFCCITLSAAFAGFIGMLLLNQLPRPHHPVMAAPLFDDSTTSKFVLVVEAADPCFVEAATRALLRQTGALVVELAPGEATPGAQEHA